MGSAQYAKRSKIMSITMQTVVNPDLTALNPHSKLILFISTSPCAMVKMILTRISQLFSGFCWSITGRSFSLPPNWWRQEAAALDEGAT